MADKKQTKQTKQEAVDEFHKARGYPIQQGMPLESLSKSLTWCAEQLSKLSQRLEGEAIHSQEHNEDCRLYRIVAIMEEISEMAAAMAKGDDVALADAIGDLDYFLTGTANLFGFPMDDIFWEIHRSNMTKKRHDDNYRMRGVEGKGKDWVPADIARVLDEAAFKELTDAAQEHRTVMKNRRFAKAYGASDAKIPSLPTIHGKLKLPKLTVPCSRCGALSYSSSDGNCDICNIPGWMEPK